MERLQDVVTYMLSSGGSAPVSGRLRKIPVALRTMTVGQVLEEADAVRRGQSARPSAERRVILETATEILSGRPM